MAKTRIKIKRAKRRGAAVMSFQLSARVLHRGQKQWEDRGVICERTVTNAAIADLVSILQAGSATAWQNFKFHASGTGTNPENAADTALQTEVETRDTGTQVSPGTGQYRTVATHTYGASFAITEHGVLSASTLGILLDRSVFSPINVINGSQIEWTYTLTISGS